METELSISAAVAAASLVGLLASWLISRQYYAPAFLLQRQVLEEERALRRLMQQRDGVLLVQTIDIQPLSFPHKQARNGSMTVNSHSVIFRRVPPAEQSQPQQGDHAVVVFVHGAASQPRVWFQAADQLICDGTVREAHCVALPGFGMSEARRGVDLAAAWGADPQALLDCFTGYLHAYVQKNCPGGRAVVCGHSFGAYVAAAFSLRFPAACDRLVLVGALGFFPVLGARSLLWGWAFRLGRWWSPFRGGALVAAFVDLEGPFGGRGRFRAPLLVDFYAARRPVVPVAVVHGARDAIVPLSFAQFLARHGAALEVLPDAGHNPMLQPEAFAQAFAAACGGSSSSSSSSNHGAAAAPPRRPKVNPLGKQVLRAIAASAWAGPAHADADRMLADADKVLRDPMYLV